MKSKVVLILILFWLLPSQSFSQEKKPTISGVTIGKKTETDTLITVNSTFLLLGTLNDYISHNYVTKGNQFDRYYPHEKTLMRYVDSIAKKDFGIQLKEEKNCFISEELASKMNAFYDENTLKKSLFDSKEKKMSFLLGVYLRNGEKINDAVYKIQLANSPKNENVYEILKQLGCKRIFFKRLDNIPTQYILYFEATKLIANHFKTVDKEVQTLFDAKIESFRSSENLKKAYQEDATKEHAKIIEMFK